MVRNSQQNRFIAQNQTNCIASLPGKSYYLEICVTSSKEFTNLGRFYRFIGAGKFLFGFFYRFISDKKILANKIVSLYSIFFSNIWYLYRFKQYIFEYRCPPLHIPYKLHGVPPPPPNLVSCIAKLGPIGLEYITQARE